MMCDFSPGLIDFYFPFLEKLSQKKRLADLDENKRLGADSKMRHFHAFGVGHCGHSKHSRKNISHYQKNIYHTQVLSKVKIILDELKALKQRADDYVAAEKELAQNSIELNVTLHLGGHSFGARICLEVLSMMLYEHEVKDEELGIRVAVVDIPGVTRRFGSIVGICPTLTHIGSSPNGKKLTWLSQRKLTVDLLLSFVKLLFKVKDAIGSVLAMIVGDVAAQMDLKMMQFYFWMFSKYDNAKLSSSFLKAVAGLMHYEVLRNCLTLGFQEMQQIKGLDMKFVENLKKDKQSVPGVKLIYLMSDNDSWVGKENETLVEETFASSADILALPVDIKHAFCINERGSFWVASKIAELLKLVT